VAPRPDESLRKGRQSHPELDMPELDMPERVMPEPVMPLRVAVPALFPCLRG